MNEKSHVTQERLYSKDKSRGRALVITKEVAGQQKSTEKLRQQKINQESQTCPMTPERGKGS
jgi:hypothetical protein